MYTVNQLTIFNFNFQISLSKVRFLILDEADRMLDLGFMPAIQELINNPHMPPKEERQTLMFSATFPDDIQQLARQIMRVNYLFLTVGRIGGANTDIEQVVVNVDQYSKRDQLISILNESGLTSSPTQLLLSDVRNCNFKNT